MQLYFSIAVITLWSIGVIYYIIFLPKKLARDNYGAKSKSRRKRLRGKRCPQCKNMISYQRQVCQHCGYQFPGFTPETKPEEKAEQVKTEEVVSKKKRGKRCPQCGNMINYYRETCQHCGYQFGKVDKEEGGESHDHGHAGKRCPQCGNVINAQRDTCQHCGHKFPEMDSAAPAPSKDALN